MAPRGKQVTEEITSRAQLMEWMKKSEKILVVIDFHLAWCGPTVVMHPMFQRLTLELDHWEKRIVFLTCDRAILNEEDKELFPVPDGCKPFFSVIKHSIAIGKVEGANSAELLAIINDNVFPVPEN